MTRPADDSVLRLALPKGRMQKGVLDLLSDAGIPVRESERGYRPSVALPETEAKILKPHNIIEMLASGSRDVGFAGADWVAEHDADLVELLDTGMDPVRLIVAAPTGLLNASGLLPAEALTVASEYERLARRWCDARGVGDTVVRSYGATEVFPPEDADCIIDNTATGSTLRANGLVIVDEIMRSSTRLYASPRALDRPLIRERIDRLVMTCRAVLDARRRVMVEMNVGADRLDALLDLLPSMRQPTVSPLRGGGGFAVRVASLRRDLAALIPKIKDAGGTDIVVTAPTHIVP